MVNLQQELRFLSVARRAGAGVVDLLKKSVIGTPGSGFTYQHTKIEDKIARIGDPYFININRNGAPLGTCCFCHRITISNQVRFHSYYIRYFSLLDQFRVKNIPEGKTIARKSFIRWEIASLLNGKWFDLPPHKKFFHYAYIDPSNKRSARLTKEFGFETVRPFAVMTFSRFFPKVDPRVVKAHRDDLPLISELLKNAYHLHTMFTAENILNGIDYFMIKDKHDKVIAGVGVYADQWKILSMASYFDTVLLKMFSGIPYVNRILNTRFRFLSLSGVYCKSGAEDELGALLETVLATYNVNVAMAAVDKESPQYWTMRMLDAGVGSGFLKEVNGDVICKFVNFTDEEKDRFMKFPAYIAAYDLT